jgi:predicted lipase
MTPRDLALIAQEAYSAAPDIGLADSASRAIVRHTPEGLVIAFRGSDNEPSFKCDADFFPIDVGGIGRVHRGFWHAWEAFSIDVLAAIKGQPVTLIGHSLGAALAMVTAIEMVISGNPPKAIFGWGPPRVSPDQSVVDLLKAVPMHLYRNGNDIVPLLPPDWPDMGPLQQIGTPVLAIPNTFDHEMARYVAATPGR